MKSNIHQKLNTSYILIIIHKISVCVSFFELLLDYHELISQTYHTGTSLASEGSLIYHMI